MKNRQLPQVDSCKLEPWMLLADWRGDDRPFLLVDLAEWPADLPIQPLPPVPLIGVGAACHPLASQMDALADDDIPLAVLATRISTAPRASATVAQLLRAIENMPADRALMCESMAFAMLQGSTEHRAWKDRQKRGDPALPGKLHVSRDGGTLHVRIDRPQASNAIDRVMRDQLFDAFELAAIDPGISRIRLAAAGRCFSIGADLREFGTTTDPAEAHSIRMKSLPAIPLLRRPDILHGHVQGACVGSGLELAAFASRLTAAPDAWFQLPETAMGILPGFGGCVSLSRRIGRQKAAALILSGKRIGARIALRWGLIDAIVDDAASDEGHPHQTG